MHSKALTFFLAVVLVVSTVGCAGKQAPTFNAKYYPECYDPIDKLCKDQSNEQEVKGAVTGGLIGALGGALVGGLTTGKIEGALVGAAAGAATGALTGFFAARLNKISDQNQRLAEYQNVLGEKSRGWDIERASVERAYTCYGDQISLLKTAVKSKRITREEFLARMQEIRAGIDHINTYWADAQNRMNSDLADGEQWLAAEDAEAARANKQKQMASRIQRQKQNTSKLRQTNSVANNKVNKVKENVMVAFNELDNYSKVDGAFTSLDFLLAMN